MDVGTQLSVLDVETVFALENEWWPENDKPTFNRPLVKSAYQKNNFLISQPKHMLWVLKITVSMRRFF